MKKIVLITVIAAVILLFTSQTSPNNVNGFTAYPGSFEILNRFQGRSNVLKVDRSKADWYIVQYPLGQYRGKKILIEFTADVWIDAAGYSPSLLWQVNDHPKHPLVSILNDPVPKQWIPTSGRVILNITQNFSFLHLNGHGHPANANIYISNPSIKITEGVDYTPDFSLIPLKDIYKNDFLMGNIVDWNEVGNTGKHFDLIKHHFNIISTGPPFMEDLTPLNKGGAYRFTEADNLINQYIRNNIQIFGHVFVMPNKPLPNWFYEGTRAEVIQNMNEYITTVVRHFKGRINAWDVVNEAVRDGLSARDARRDWKDNLYGSPDRPNLWNPKNIWYEKIGPDYIELAFRAARAADPDIKLYYNENSLELNLHKTDVVVKMIKDINDRYKKETGGTRNLIDGVGTQMHIWTSDLNINNVRSHFEKLSSLGIEIAVTEMDVPGKAYYDGIVKYGYDTDMSERDAIAQALVYARIMQVIKEYSAHITHVTFWGLDDNTSWLSSLNPALFDWKLNAKHAFHAVSDPDSFIRQYGGSTRR